MLMDIMMIVRYVSMSAGSGDMRRSQEVEVCFKEEIKGACEGSQSFEGKCKSAKAYRERYRRVPYYEGV
jgi:hypothetical protein